MMSDGLENSEYLTLSGEIFPGGVLGYATDNSKTLPGFVRRSNNFENNGSVVQPFDPGHCNQLKNNGHTIYTIQTEYTTTPEMQNSVSPLARFRAIDGWVKNGELETSFLECATDYTKSSYTVDEDIIDAVQDVFNAAIETPIRVTN